MATFSEGRPSVTLARPIVRMRDAVKIEAPSDAMRKKKQKAKAKGLSALRPPLVSAGQLLRATLLVLAALIYVDHPRLPLSALKFASRFSTQLIDYTATASIAPPAKTPSTTSR